MKAGILASFFSVQERLKMMVMQLEPYKGFFLE
jgi:hypothetical protein